MRHDELELAKPPMWADKSDTEVQQMVTALVEDQATDLQKERARQRKGVLGPTQVKRLSFRTVPQSPKRSPRVKCLCADDDKKKAYLEERMATVDAYKRAMGKWRNGKARARFPAGTFPPGQCRCA